MNVKAGKSEPHRIENGTSEENPRMMHRKLQEGSCGQSTEVDRERKRAASHSRPSHPTSRRILKIKKLFVLVKLTSPRVIDQWGARLRSLRAWQSERGRWSQAAKKSRCSRIARCFFRNTWHLGRGKVQAQHVDYSRLFQACMWTTSSEWPLELNIICLHVPLPPSLEKWRRPWWRIAPYAVTFKKDQTSALVQWVQKSDLNNHSVPIRSLRTQSTCCDSVNAAKVEDSEPSALLVLKFYLLANEELNLILAHMHNTSNGERLLKFPNFGKFCNDNQATTQFLLRFSFPELLSCIWMCFICTNGHCHLFCVRAQQVTD